MVHFSTLAAMAVFAAVASTNPLPQTPDAPEDPARFFLKTRLSDDTVHPEFNNLYVQSASTGPAWNEAVLILQSERGLATPAFLNWSSIVFDLGDPTTYHHLRLFPSQGSEDAVIKNSVTISAGNSSSTPFSLDGDVVNVHDMDFGQFLACTGKGDRAAQLYFSGVQHVPTEAEGCAGVLLVTEPVNPVPTSSS